MPPIVPRWIRSVTVPLALSLFGDPPALADWPTSSLVNVPVCTAAGAQLGPVVTTDGSGGVILTWSDARAGSTNYDMYAQHVLASGVVDPGWAANGQAICTATGRQFTPKILSDGAGGAVLTWHDFRNGTTSDVYAQHVFASGVVDPAWPANGQAICTAAGNQNAIVMVSDEAGGAIMAWRDFRAGTTSDVYAQHVFGNGQIDPAWPVDGRALCTQPDSQSHPITPTIARDGHGGAIVAWQDFRSQATFDVYAQHVRANGSLDPAWPVDGRALCTAANDQRNPDMVADRAGGAIVCWRDSRGGTTSDIYAQHVRADGVVDPGWPVDGQVVCSAVGDQQLPRIAADGAGGALIVWVDSRSVSSGQDLYAQHLLASGMVDPGWPGDGRAVCTAFGTQINQTVVADGAGGVLVAWQDARTSVFDIYLQHVLASGVADPAWPLDGRAVCTAAQSQQLPATLADGSGGAIVAWTDARADFFGDIYAQRVQANGQLGGTVVDVPREPSLALALDAVRPNPWRGGVLILTFSLQSRRAATLEVIDIAGRRVVTSELEARGPGRGSATIELSRHLTPGVYLVRLRQGGAARLRRFAVIE